MLVLALLMAGVMVQADTPSTRPRNAEGEIRSAESAYAAGRLPEAETLLKTMVIRQPGSFAAHELLGLVYVAQSESERARSEFETAVRLNPESATALNNLATASVRAGRPADAATAWNRVLLLVPGDPVATQNLAKLYLSQNRVAAAIPLLESVRRADPHATDAGYNLALAYFVTGKLDPARAVAESLLRESDLGETHSLLGQIDEKQGRYIDAVNEFTAAARREASENNLFLWASELMLHRAYEPAITIYKRATAQYPDSPRLWIGLGMAQYSRGEYDDAIHSLLKGASLDPHDLRCYLFLSKAYLSAPSQADEVIDCFRRYAELEPQNARAQFYYAVGLWKGRRLESATVDFRTVESLFQKAVALDGNDPQAHLQLGILYNDEGEYPKALPEFERALALDPNLPDAHFRLARYWFRVGDKSRGQAEMDRFRELQAKHQAELDRERAAIQQFVVSTQDNSAGQP